MSATTGPIRFEPNGPQETGLEVWEEMTPDELLSAVPVQRGHIYHEEPSTGYLAGVWDCTAFDAKPGPYSVDEYMFLLEGSVVMGLPDGTDIVVEAGQAFVIPKGFECQWKQPGYVKKFFMILDGGEGGGGANPSLERISVPDLRSAIREDGAADDAEQGAVAGSRMFFVNHDHSMTVSLTTHVASSTPMLASGIHELVQVLDGAIRLVTEGGADHAFEAGSSFYLPGDCLCAWHFDGRTRLLRSGYAPRV